MLEKYVGRNVVIIYHAKDGQLTQRRIRVQSIAEGRIRAYDLSKRAPRVFDVDRILAVHSEAVRV